MATAQISTASRARRVAPSWRQHYQPARFAAPGWLRRLWCLL
jgi:hypothetical protein